VSAARGDAGARQLPGGESSSTGAPEALAGDARPPAGRGYNEAGAGGVPIALQAATSYPLARWGSLKGAAVRSLAYLLLRPRPLAGGFAQPERGYNHAGAGGVPAVMRGSVLVLFPLLRYPRPMTEPDPKLTPAEPDYLADSPSFALRFEGRKSQHDSDRLNADIVASGWSDIWIRRGTW
jgi:hypothetical protein